jgi:hypothetical protein
MPDLTPDQRIDADRPLPTIAEMTGSDPNITGSMTTEDYVRQMRESTSHYTPPLSPIPTSREILGWWAGHPRLTELRKAAKDELARDDVGAYVHWLERNLLDVLAAAEDRMIGAPE